MSLVILKELWNEFKKGLGNFAPDLLLQDIVSAMRRDPTRLVLHEIYSFIRILDV